MAAWTGKIDVVVTALLVACALITTGLVVRRELLQTAVHKASAAQRSPVYIKNWRTHLAKGRMLGPAGAPVHLIEFVDYQCPFCASFRMTLDAVRDRHPLQVALTIVHYPLVGHQFAERAAHAAECAADQGSFETMNARLFERQSSLSAGSWRMLASEAGVADLVRFDSCMESIEPMRRVVEGKQLADQLAVQGTPTILVNGWKLPSPPTLEELDHMVQQILAGEEPFSAE